MKELIEKIHNRIKHLKAEKTSLENEKLTTHIKNYYDNYSFDLIKLSKAFNGIFDFKGNSPQKSMDCIILNDNELFNELDYYLLKSKLYETATIVNFNNATRSSSILKCSKDKNYYIMKCYDYFFYLFNNFSSIFQNIVIDNKIKLV